MKLMDISALSEMLGLPKSWIYDRTRASGDSVIPHIKAGKYLRFDPDSEEFKEWLASLKVNQHNRPREKERDMETKSMTRSTYQKGSVQKRRRKNRTIWVLRYRLRDGNHWINKTEEMTGKATEREARRAADARMVEITTLGTLILSPPHSNYVRRGHSYCPYVIFESRFNVVHRSRAFHESEHRLVERVAGVSRFDCGNVGAEIKFLRCLDEGRNKFSLHSNQAFFSLKFFCFCHRLNSLLFAIME